MNDHRVFKVVSLLCVFACGSFAAATPPHANIIYILADDLGYGDVSCYNAASKIQTPQVDRIATIRDSD